MIVPHPLKVSDEALQLCPLFRQEKKEEAEEIVLDSFDRSFFLLFEKGYGLSKTREV
jgi:hypothetical protein